MNQLGLARLVVGRFENHWSITHEVVLRLHGENPVNFHFVEIRISDLEGQYNCSEVALLQFGLLGSRLESRRSVTQETVTSEHLGERDAYQLHMPIYGHTSNLSHWREIPIKFFFSGSSYSDSLLHKTTEKRFSSAFSIHECH